jgi:hypothetical protein
MTLEELIAARESAHGAYISSLKHSTICGDTGVEDEAYRVYVDAVIAVKRALAV